MDDDQTETMDPASAGHPQEKHPVSSGGKPSENSAELPTVSVVGPVATDADATTDVPSIPTAAVFPKSSFRIPANPAEASLPNVPGYEIKSRLGAGGMGAVWKGIQLSTRREVAVKLLNAAGMMSPRAQARFEREVELAASLSHPNIAQVYDSGLADGVYHYAMELVPGDSLDVHVEKAQPGRKGLLRLMIDICRAMQFAHQRGIIHRDLKPSNIQVTPKGIPKLLDFGLARAVEPTPVDQAISIAGEATGTPRYMSPEQAHGMVDELDTRTDVYSLGIILYELTTGARAIPKNKSLFAVLEIVVKGDIKAPRAVAVDFPIELEAIILKAIALGRENRYGSAGELADDLERFLAGEPVLARPQTSLYVARKWVVRHRWAVSAAAAVFLAAVAGIVVYIVNITAEQAATLAAKNKAENERQSAVQASLRAGEQRALALRLVRDFVSHAQRELSRDSAQLKLRRQLLEIAIAGLNRISTIDVSAEDRSADQTLAGALVQMGDIDLAAGRTVEALAAYQRATALLGRIVSQPAGFDVPAHHAAMRDFSIASLRIARVYLDQGRSTEAAAAIRSAEQALQSLENGAASIDLRRDRWVLATLQAEDLLSAGKPADAASRLDVGLKNLESAMQAGDPKFTLADQVSAEQKLAVALMAVYDQAPKSSVVELKRADELLAHAVASCRNLLSSATLAGKSPAAQERRNLAVAISQSASIDVRLRRGAAARTKLKEAIDLIDEACRVDSDRADWSMERQRMKNDLSDIESQPPG